MPGISPIKSLYLAKSIEELQKLGLVQSQKPDLLVKVFQKILSDAKECENGDQEKSYVLFFKYCEFARAMRRSPEYKRDKLYYDSMVSSKNVKDALDHLHSLTLVLEERYDEKRRNEALKTVRKRTEVQKFDELENSKLKREVQSAKEIHSSKTCMNEKMSEITTQRIVQDDMLKSEKEGFKDPKELTIPHANNPKFEVENRNLTESKFTSERNKMLQYPHLDTWILEVRIKNLTEMRKFGECENSKSKRQVQIAKEIQESKVTQNSIMKLGFQNQTAQDRNEKLEIENRRQITFLKAEKKRLIYNFELKLRERESDYYDKIMANKEGVGDKIKAACNEIISKKDQEFRQCSITMHQEMDEKMRIEMNSLKNTLEMQNNAQKDKAIELYQLEKDHEICILQNSWKDEQERLNKELKVQQRKWTIYRGKLKRLPEP